MTTPVRPTPALQCTTTGGLRLFEVSSIELVCLLTDWISSRYAAEKKSHIDLMSSLYAGSVLTHIINKWRGGRTYREIPVHIQDSPAQASLCIAGARPSSPGQTAGV